MEKISQEKRNERTIGINFGISVSPRDIVESKKIISKYAPETGLKFHSYRYKDFSGYWSCLVGLRGSVEPKDADYVLEVLMGLIEEMARDVGSGLVEEDANPSNTNYAPIVEGKDLKLPGVKDKDVYMLREISEVIFVYSRVEDMLKLEKEQSDLLRKIFLMTPTEWYKENTALLKKDLPEAEEFELAKDATALFEKKTSVKKKLSEGQESV